MSTIHASCVLLGAAGAALSVPPECGILLIGESGAGKSELALRLIERGSQLVSDDRTELRSRNGALIASAPGTLAGLLEIRCLGIFKLPHAAEAQIALVALLQAEPGPRLPPLERYTPPDSVRHPIEMQPRLIRIRSHEPAAPAKILMAAAATERTIRCHDDQFS